MAYTKFHESWVSSDLLTAKALNHIDETQWEAIANEADVHAHDSRYYTKSLADATFFSLSHYAGFDADKLDGYQFSELVATILPVGAILIWKGTDGDVPDGWAICNGQPGTPDLRDKFIIGAGGAHGIGATGGSFSISPTGSIVVDSHVLTNDEMPLHQHDYLDYANGNPGNCLCNITTSGPVGSLTYLLRTTDSAGGGGGHGHTGSSIAMNTMTATPPYYALYYIKKVA